MSAGNPIDRRPPIAGAEPGDRLAVRAITAREYDQLDAARTRNELDRLRLAAPNSDLVVIAVPQGKAGTISRAITARLEQRS
jgi:hypothetical protein